MREREKKRKIYRDSSIIIFHVKYLSKIISNFLIRIMIILIRNNLFT